MTSTKATVLHTQAMRSSSLNICRRMKTEDGDEFFTNFSQHATVYLVEFEWAYVASFEHNLKNQWFVCIYDHEIRFKKINLCIMLLLFTYGTFT